MDFNLTIPKMSGIVERLRSESASSRIGPGKALSIYDGRKWPVVKCGAVYVTDEDKAKTVTKNVILLSSASEEKKKQKSSKYTVAIGSSFGHVHSFLKDSDNVLKSYEKTKAEDKCLLLIRKPRSASKQMLKAHSWADVSVRDMHLRQSDGSVKQDPYKAFKDRFKKRSDLSLPPDEWNSLANQSSPFKGPTANHSTSFKSLSSADEGKEETKSDIISHYNTHSEVVPNISNSYPYIKRGSKNISQSLADLTDTGREINNNKSMGGALSQGHTRPKGPPPSVPTRTSASMMDAHNNNSVSNVENRGQLHMKNSKSEAVENRPDIISNVNMRNSPGNSVRPGHSSQTRTKHDSGFHSEAPLSSDEIYDSGFKLDLSNSAKNGSHLTSSPRASMEKQSTVMYGNVQRNLSNPRHPNVQPKVPTGKAYYNKVPSPGSKNSHQINGHGNAKSSSRPEVEHVRTANSPGSRNPHQINGFGNANSSSRPEVEHDRTANSPGSRKPHQINGHGHAKSSPMAEAEQVRADNTRPVLRNYSSGLSDRNHQNEQSQYSLTSRTRPEGQSYPNANQRNKQNEPHYSEVDNRNQQNHYQNGLRQNESRTNSAQRHMNDLKQRQSLGDVKEDQILTFDNKEAVIKAHSLGDLSTGCAFSLVGQKKQNMPLNAPVPEFTGTQLMKHIRHYREMTQNGINGSLPFKGKAIDDMENYTQQCQPRQHQPLSSKGDHSNYNKLKHYGSLQYLPMSNGSDNNKQPPVRHREKTPLKPRRCLPQPPGDVQDKKRQITDIMISRMSVESNSTSPSTSNSNREGSVEPRPGGISATPSVSDREVSELLLCNRSDSTWSVAGVRNVCNTTANNNIKQNPASQVPQSYSVNNTLRKSGSFGSHEQGNVLPSGGRLSESGQTTLTSQSTIDSGYTTNDPDQESLSTSNYAKTLKQSAHNMYLSHKHYTPAKGDHYQQQTSNTKGDNISHSAGNQYHQKQSKEAHTRKWLENHPGTYMSEQLKLNLKRPTKDDVIGGSGMDKTDKNNNKHPRIPENNVTELDLTIDAPVKPERTFQYGKQPLAHHKSELSSKDIERMTQDTTQFSCRSKGKSISMAQGLNLIARNSEPQNGGFLTKSQPKFTGSLKDLIGTNKQIVPIETLRLDGANSANTLPGSWKFQAQTRPESSLRFFGKPSLFQLLQNYNLYAVRVRIPENFVIMDNVRLIECEVVLPTPWIFGKDTSSTLSPKGSYAKLGGPNSAFRPVSVMGTSTVKSISMVTIMELSSQITELMESGQLRKGDLIVEVNERLTVGEDLPTLTSVFQGCHGELLLTVARDRARDNHPSQDMQSTSPTDEDFRRMQQKMNELTTELRKKDRTLKQLNALLPWKLPSDKGRMPDSKDEDAYVCSLSEDEFIV